MYKPVPKDMLRAFGFRKAKRKQGDRFPTKDTWYNPELNIFYSPTLHTQARFADNLRDAICHQLGNNMSAECHNLFPRIR